MIWNEARSNIPYEEKMKILFTSLLIYVLKKKQALSRLGGNNIFSEFYITPVRPPSIFSPTFACQKHLIVVCLLINLWKCLLEIIEFICKIKIAFGSETKSDDRERNLRRSLLDILFLSYFLINIHTNILRISLGNIWQKSSVWLSIAVIIATEN